MPTKLIILAAAISLASVAIAGPSKRKLKKLSAAPTINTTVNDVRNFVKALDNQAVSQGNSHQLIVDGVQVLVVTDGKANRMRIIAPVAKAATLDKAMLETLLEANFDRALDARYSLNKGVVWAAYIQPLSPTTKREFSSGARQVAALVKNYGSTFSSTSVVFGP